MILNIILTLIIIAGISAPTIVVSIENKQHSENTKILDKNKVAPTEPDSIVIYFSRSGNTAIMANKIAQIHNAKLINIEAPKYEIGIKGLAQAAMSYQNREVEIDPKVIDLTKYKRVFIGSPIWFYRPSPPVFEFAKMNKFEGKEVILFNSYNSNFGQDHIDEFESLVKEKGATSFNHLAVKRGRMGRQISSQDFLRIIEDVFSPESINTLNK